MDTRFITIKNIRGYKLEIPYKNVPYTVKNLILELCKKLNDNAERTEYKILLDGEILDDDYDLSSHEQNTNVEFIYLRRAKKNATDMLDSVAKYVMGLHIDILLKNPSSIKTLISMLPKDIFVHKSTDLDVENCDIDTISNIIKTYVNNFNLPYNIISDYPNLEFVHEINQSDIKEASDDDDDDDDEWSTDSKPKIRRTYNNGDENEDDEWSTDDDDGEDKNNENEDDEDDENKDDEDDEHSCDSCDNNKNVIDKSLKKIIEEGFIDHVPEEIWNQFTENEKIEIKTIVDNGFPLFETVQTYIVCEKNMDRTLDLLITP